MIASGASILRRCIMTSSYRERSHGSVDRSWVMHRQHGEQHRDRGERRRDRLARKTFDLFAIVKQIVDAKAQFFVPSPSRGPTPAPAPGA
jgi:hypothetical protein